MVLDELRESWQGVLHASIAARVFPKPVGPKTAPINLYTIPWLYQVQLVQKSLNRFNYGRTINLVN